MLSAGSITTDRTQMLRSAQRMIRRVGSKFIAWIVAHQAAVPHVERAGKKQLPMKALSFEKINLKYLNYRHRECDFNTLTAN